MVAAALDRPGSASHLMETAFREIPRVHVESFTALFRALAANEVPLLFHCTAGKDRTGIAAALILDLLGVERAAIFDDFIRSDDSIAQTRTRFLDYPGNAAALSSPQSLWEPIMTAHPSYLAAMFDQIEQDFGGTEGYVRKQLGLSFSDVQTLRTHLLAPALMRD